MYESHCHLQEPDPDAYLWRYMDLAKFLNLLETQSLYLAALRTFSDPFEGHPPRSAIDPMTNRPDNLTPELVSERRRIISNNIGLFLASRDLIFASCWHMNEHESAGMWSQYVKSGEGLAVRTTFQRLTTALTPAGPSVAGGIVEYINFETHPTAQFNLYTWAVLKRESFSHEREFRLVSMQNPGPDGIHVAVRVQDLVEKVFVAPTTPDWMYELVKSLISRYDLDVEVVRSELNQPPNYFVLPQWLSEAESETQEPTS